MSKNNKAIWQTKHYKITKQLVKGGVTLYKVFWSEFNQKGVPIQHIEEFPSYELSQARVDELVEQTGVPKNII